MTGTSGATCACCHTPIAPAGALRCPLCDGAHHEDCWEENVGCAATGCSAGPGYEDQGRAVAARAATPATQRWAQPPPPPPPPAQEGWLVAPRGTPVDAATRPLVGPAGERQASAPPRVRAPLLAAAALLGAVAGGVAFFQLSGQDAATSASNEAGAGSERTASAPVGSRQPSPAVSRRTPPPPRALTPAPATTSAAASTLPPTPFFVAIVVSKGDADGGRSAAGSYLDDIEQAGYDALLFESTDYSHLRPGYWVAAAGTWSTIAPAQEASRVLQGRFGPEASTVYPRCVGSSEQCAGAGG